MTATRINPDYGVTSSMTLATNVFLYTCGRIVMLVFYGNSIPANTGTYSTRHIIGTVPSGLRPPRAVHSQMNTSTSPHTIRVGENGEVSARNSTASAVDCYECLTWIAM